MENNPILASLIVANAELDKIKIFYSILASINEIEEEKDIPYLKKVLEIISGIPKFKGDLYLGKLTNHNPLTLEAIAVTGDYGTRLDDAYRGSEWRKNSLALKAINSGEFAWTGNYKEDKKLNKNLGISYNTCSCGAIPIIRDKKVWGIISIASPEPDIFTKDTINIVGRVSSAIGRKLREIDLKKRKKKPHRQIGI